MTRMRWAAAPVLSALLGAVAAAGCGSDQGTPVDVDASSPADTARPDTGGGSDVGQPDGSTQTPDVVGDASPDPEDGSGAACTIDPAQGIACCAAADCGPRGACVENQCVRSCSTDAECNDDNLCTDDACVVPTGASRGTCAWTPVTPTLVDARRGDCRRQACVDGALEEVPDEADLPPDDGIPCTVERCVGRFPQSLPDHTLCDDFVSENGSERCSLQERGCVTGEPLPWVCETFDPGWLSQELCDDGQDNDNDGQVDEGCPCTFGQVQRCFAGPPASRNVGGCTDGYQQCENRLLPQWGPCRNATLPEAESCDAKDNDCNGCVDDLPDCTPILACPSGDTTRPLRTYPLDALAIFGGTGSSYRWTVIPPANSATPGPRNATSPQTDFFVDVSGDYRIQLVVEDDKGKAFGCSWILRAQGSGLRVEARWDTFGSVDVDLHLHRSGTTTNFCTSDDCYYANCKVTGTSINWGYPSSPGIECNRTSGTCPNPRLDIDNISRFDPENINIDNPNHNDSFRIFLHKFSGSAVTNPVVSVYCGGTLRAVLGEAPDRATLRVAGSGCGGESWRPADVRMLVDPRTGVTDCLVNVLTGSNGGWDIRTSDPSY